LHFWPSSNEFSTTVRTIRRSILLAVATLLVLPTMAAAGSGTLDPILAARAQAPRGISRVIITTIDGGPADAAIRASGGTAGRFLRALGGQVALVPDSSLVQLASRPEIRSVSFDRPVTGTLERTAAAIGATWVREDLGFDGTGVGVAIVDSGVANWHDDLGSQTVVHFVDFVTDLMAPHDDYGHGTHVAGIIAGNGYDSGGARTGIAPGANLIVLKVLDESGDGHISNVIAAIDYAVEHRGRFNIRVLNLSVAAGVHESYTTDPLTLAARRAVDAGIVVVTAAGNLGRSAKGAVQYGGITSPGNAPWVLTVGATNHQKTAARQDDTVASFSSRGPTHIDRAMKPDVVAPGVAIESLADAGSTIYQVNPEARLRGTVDTVTPPYIRLTGTSMAAPVVAGTVALMLEANPDLTPNLVKAILHYTAERRPRYESTTQGAGFLNARGAVQLAMAMGGEAEGVDPTRWSRQILWGNRRISGGQITADANAWRRDVVWGASTTPAGEPVVWGVTADSETPWSRPLDGVEPVTTDDYAGAGDGLWADEARNSVMAAGVPSAVPTLPRTILALIPEDRRRVIPGPGAVR
jgi:serine protease AprX